MNRTQLDRLGQDLRFAWRLWLRSPGFSAIAIATLALGIGATTAIFTVVNGVLLRPLPFPEPDRLVMVWERGPNRDRNNVVQTQNYLDWRARNQSFSGLAALVQRPVNVAGVAGAGEAEQMVALRVTGEFFDVLGVHAMLGRTFRRGEDVPNGPRLAVLGHDLWQQRYGGDPAIVGRTIDINGSPHEVIGVMAPGFAFPGTTAALFVQLVIDPKFAQQDGRNFRTVGRLKPGVTLDASRAEMINIAAQTERERPVMNAKWSARVVSLRDQAIGDVRRPLLVLFGAVICVLLIACANIANLLSMRSTARTREFTMRLALGAGHWRLMQQLVIESLVLAAIGGALGLLLARAGVPAILSLFPATFPLPRAEELGAAGGVDFGVLAFTFAVSMAAGICFGLAPAFQARRRNPAETLRAAGHAVAGGSTLFRRTLVVVEVTLAVVLVVGASLMVRSMVQIYRVDPGFRAERVLTMRMMILPSKYRDMRRASFLAEVLERIREVPQVTAAGSTHFLPLSGSNSGTWAYRTDRPEPPPGNRPVTGVSVITPGYLRAMGIPVIKGRDISESDNFEAPRIALINRTLAEQFFPGEEPIGKKMTVWWSSTRGEQIPQFEIVGVVGDIRHDGLQIKSDPSVFLAHMQEPNSFASLVIRTTGDPLALAPAVRQQIRRVDPDQGVSNVEAMTTVMADSVARPRLQTLLLGAFGALALLMACLGLYGVLSYSVEQRRREMGVRLALGAAPGSILRLVVGEGLRLTTAGVVGGLIAAFVLTRYLATLLYDVAPHDVSVFTGVAATLLIVASLACWLPARRATRVDPASILRDE